MVPITRDLCTPNANYSYTSERVKKALQFRHYNIRAHKLLFGKYGAGAEPVPIPGPKPGEKAPITGAASKHKGRSLLSRIKSATTV